MPGGPVKKGFLIGVAALFLATGATPSPAQNCDYNSPSYFKCKEKQEKRTPWIWRCSFPHAPNGYQLDWSEQCCKRWPNAPNCNGDYAKAMSVPRCAKLPFEANVKCAERILLKINPGSR